MPNSLDREAFEEAYRDRYPSQTKWPDVFDTDASGEYINGHCADTYFWWQAGAAAERERVNMPCTHENGYAKWDHWACRDCGAVKPDGVREGRPNNGWFPSMESFSAWKNGDRGIT